MTITDEMVEIAWETAKTPYHAIVKNDLRRALEAVAPMLIAAYLRKLDMGGDLYLNQLFSSLAQELDPK